MADSIMALHGMAFCPNTGIFSSGDTFVKSIDVVRLVYHDQNIEYDHAVNLTANLELYILPRYCLFAPDICELWCSLTFPLLILVC